MTKDATPADDQRKFGLLVGSIAAALGFLLMKRSFETRVALLAVGASLILSALLFPGGLRPLYRGWMKFGALLGRINAFVLLSLLFFLVLTPLAYIKRWLSGNDQKFSCPRDRNSYWIPKVPTHPDIQEDLKRQF